MNSNSSYVLDLKKQVNLLLDKHKELKEAISVLNSERLKLLRENENLEVEIKELKKRVEVANLAKGRSIKGDDSVSFARVRVNNLIRLIDKCISLLNE